MKVVIVLGICILSKHYKKLYYINSYIKQNHRKKYVCLKWIRNDCISIKLHAIGNNLDHSLKC